MCCCIVQDLGSLSNLIDLIVEAEKRGGWNKCKNEAADKEIKEEKERIEKDERKAMKSRASSKITRC